MDNNFKILSCINLSKSYGTHKIITDLNLEIINNEIHGIIGESGAGKTTLVNMISNIESYKGEIYFGGYLSTKIDPQIQVVFQNIIESLNPHMKIKDIVTEGLQIKRDQDPELLYSLMHQMNLSEDLLDKYPKNLSAGERQRIAIIRALIVKPKLLILDEAFSMLDLVNRKRVLDCLLDWREHKKLTIVIISHDLDLIKKYCNNISLLNNGQISSYSNQDFSSIFE